AGAVSLPATVTVTIEKTRSGVTYADTGEATATAAQDLAERGVFTGAKIGDKWYFEPDRTVSRGEFLAMVLETAGAEVTDVTMTGFRDDDAIPTWAKSYAAAGVAEGILRGKLTEDGAVFSCEEPISFSEAATVLNRVLDLGDVELEVWFADREAVPSWAAQAVGNMEALNVLSVGSFGSDRLETAVTRADAARMLSAAGTLLRGEKDTGLLGLLKKS
ncbi:surface layer protein, partial [Dysosmobacter sp.]|uniref:surface layer protein n=1 Tax=Dysosmobacter sp. TaxID=2591382 RepID=UPI003AB906F4